MRKELAERIAVYFQDLANIPDSGFQVARFSESPLTGYHPWADGRPLVGAYSCTRNGDDSLDILLIDWRHADNWYLVACEPDSHAPLAEIHDEDGTADRTTISWRYRPSKRDGRNGERADYFRRVVGSHTLAFSIPNRNEITGRFLDDVFELVDIRLRADRLDEARLEPRTAFPEGEVLERLHRLRERNSKVVTLAKELARKNGHLKCEICSFDFARIYGDLGAGYIEAHHVVPVSELKPNSMTRVEDFALVCANCHRMLHRRRPWLGKHELRTILAAGEPA